MKICLGENVRTGKSKSNGMELRKCLIFHPRHLLNRFIVQSSQSTKLGQIGLVLVRQANESLVATINYYFFFLGSKFNDILFF